MLIYFFTGVDLQGKYFGGVNYESVWTIYMLITMIIRVTLDQTYFRHIQGWYNHGIMYPHTSLSIHV